MNTTAVEPTPVQTKVRELCEAIVAQPEFESIKRRVEAFMADDGVKQLYQSVVEKGDALQQKQQQGHQLTPDEITGFEKERETLFGNSVAKGFLDAQQEMHEMQQEVGQFISKTFELGRIPTDDDLKSESCGSGCGCHS